MKSTVQAPVLPHPSYISLAVEPNTEIPMDTIAQTLYLDNNLGQVFYAVDICKADKYYGAYINAVHELGSNPQAVNVLQCVQDTYTAHYNKRFFKHGQALITTHVYRSSSTSGESVTVRITELTDYSDQISLEYVWAYARTMPVEEKMVLTSTEYR